MGSSARQLRLLAAGCILICLLTLARMLWLLTLGEGIPSDDSLLNARLIGKMLDGGYRWNRLFRDAYTNGHFNFFPILAQYLWALLTGWNFRLALFLGAGLALLKIFLLHSALARPPDRVFSWLLWPFLFGLTFAVTAMDVFQLDSSSLQLGLNHFGLILGVWALSRFPGEWRAVLLAATGAWLATWSWGSGIMAWPAFFLGMILLGFRKFSQYAVMAAAASLAAWPYLHLLLVEPILGQEPKLLGFFNFRLIVESLGLIFAQAYSPEMAWWRGLAGLILLALGIFLCLRRRMDRRSWAVPAMLLLYVVLHFYQVSLFRSRLMPWYAYQASLFWVGLLGLAYALILKRGNPWWPALLALSLAYFYATSNITWQDKVASLAHQGPASVACLQSYRSAPKIECDRLLFRWKPYEDFREMAQALERHRLSLFSRAQVRSLQGDMVLGKVRFQGPATASLSWLKGDRELPFTDFRRLDVEVPPGSEIEWMLDSAGSEKIRLGPGRHRYPSIQLEQ